VKQKKKNTNGARLGFEETLWQAADWYSKSWWLEDAS